MSTPERPAPTPEQIAQRSAEIRRGWTPGEEERRRGVRSQVHRKISEKPLPIQVVSTKYLRLAARDDREMVDG